MIKIFGKLRYHWQPELSLLIIYWSLAFIPVFLSMALLYEDTTSAEPSLLFFLAFLILIVAGLHRYFEIVDGKDELLIFSSIPGLPKRIRITSISKIAVSKHRIKIYCGRWPSGRVFYMRKWTKKYFLDALVSNPFFKGEAYLIGDARDYFTAYKDEEARIAKKKGPKA
ncbi:EbsA protein [Streptococcaceae bacterium ESL0729]|nr:EbsA protein [Streptococcaceae bacterium ESL0729]